MHCIITLAFMLHSVAERSDMVLENCLSRAGGMQFATVSLAHETFAPNDLDG